MCILCIYSFVICDGRAGRLFDSLRPSKHNARSLCERSPIHCLYVGPHPHIRIIFHALWLLAVKLLRYAACCCSAVRVSTTAMMMGARVQFRLLSYYICTHRLKPECVSVNIYMRIGWVRLGGLVRASNHILRLFSHFARVDLFALFGCIVERPYRCRTFTHS